MIGFNGIIKRVVTFRERLPIAEFIRVVLIGMTAELSTDYREGKRINTDKPEIKIAQWMEAALWLSDAEYVHYNDDNLDKEFYIKSSKMPNIVFDIENVEKMRTRKFKSLDKYRNERHGAFWTMKLNKSNWTDSLCDCPMFRKIYVCKHVIGIALREKCCKLPRKAIVVPLGKKPQRGRKPRATKGLEK